MKAERRVRMLRSVDKTGTWAARQMRPAVAGLVRACLVTALAFVALGSVARADAQVDGTVAPIVRINIRQGDVTVRTWDRDAVSVLGDPSLSVDKHTSQQSGQLVSIPIPELAPPANVAARVGDAFSLPPETFVTSTVPPGPRDVVVIKSTDPAARGPVTVLVPSDAVFVFAHVGNGKLDVDGYHGGTLIAMTRIGAVNLSNLGGTVFAQTFRGPIVARASTFDRVRARSLFGNVTFERCNVRQIEATTVAGSIVYDRGSFAPGLARFESIDGNVAIGASGNVQYGAHAMGDGRVYTNFTGRVSVDARNGQTSAIVGDGGPVVTATSQGGSVFLYDGTLRNRGQLPPEWQPAVDTLQRPGTGQAPALRAPQRFVPPPAFRRFTHVHER